MEDIKNKRNEIREEAISFLTSLSDNDAVKLKNSMLTRLFELANFLESSIVLLYIGNKYDICYKSVIDRSLKNRKIVALPLFDESADKFELLKINNPEKDIIKLEDGSMVPDETKCKKIPLDYLDITLVPGFAFDEKGGRIGTEDDSYNEIIPRLPITSRKVSICFEGQIFSAIPMESEDKYVDIIVTEERVIYKI